MRVWIAKVLLLLFSAVELAAQDRVALIQQHYQRAREALAQHDLQRASYEYAEILKLDPQNSEVSAAQGMTLYGLGKPAEAAAALKHALGLNPEQANVELFLGLAQSDLGQCDQAVPLLRKYFHERTEKKLRRLVGISLLSCHLSGPNLDEAIDLGRTLRQLYPEDADVLYHVATVYSRLWNEAVAELVKKAPDSFRVHQLAGEALEAQGKGDQAIKEYRKALEINPKVPQLHYRIGRIVLAESGDSEADRKALEHFERELAINAGNASAHLEMGEIFRKGRNFEAARKHYDRALELSPALVEARVGLSKVYLAEQKPERALKELEEAIRQDPRNAAVRYALMLTYRDLGRTEDAQRELRIFQNLEEEKTKSFNMLLQSLLTGKSLSPP